MLMHDVPINWRLAHRGIVDPCAALSFTVQAFDQHHSPLDVFLALHPNLPLLPIRDWLHDESNNQHGYSLFGRYGLRTGRRCVFTGLLIEFFDEADACLFSLSWR